MTNALAETIQRYLGGDETPYDGLALLRPYLVHDCLGDRLGAFMLTLHARGDQPTLLDRLRRYTAARDPETCRQFDQATAPLFSQTAQSIDATDTLSQPVD